MVVVRGAGAAVSLASLMLSDLPGISVLRLMRTFRVLRLFNKLRSLRTLINALAASLVPVFNAFIIMVLILVIYAILGVELFQNRNPEAFGTFAIASYTVPPSRRCPPSQPTLTHRGMCQPHNSFDIWRPTALGAPSHPH